MIGNDVDFQKDLKEVSQYLETALKHHSFMPMASPVYALVRVQYLFKLVVTGQVITWPESHYLDAYNLVFRQLYLSKPKELEAAYSFLRELGKCYGMLKKDVVIGEEVLEVLKMLRVEENLIACTYAQLGMWVS
ncbi:MAG: hypothetical protein G01um101470_739 [Parcubacteria group bacterium Gr01-1014_70]|nr:MAG: hypothetical protein G01um101470_739 [Parcubacteria group bacterium Gr01-1014_70]